MVSLRIMEGTSLKECLDDLNTTLMDLKNIDIKVDDEDAALTLLCSLLLSYENFANSFMVGRIQSLLKI